MEVLQALLESRGQVAFFINLSHARMDTGISFEPYAMTAHGLQDYPPRYVPHYLPV